MLTIVHDLFGPAVEAALYLALIAFILCFKEKKKKVTVRALDVGIYAVEPAKEVSSKLRGKCERKKRVE